MLKRLLEKVFYSGITILILISTYLALGLVGSITMLDTSYMFFYEWPVVLRFVYVVFSLYVLVRAIWEDLTCWYRGGGT